MILDTLTNLISGMGGRADKSAHSTFITPDLDALELINAYRGSAITKKIVNIPVDDATREWREWSGDPLHVEQLNAAEITLGVQVKIKEAMIAARLYGGAAILIGTGDEDAEEPLMPESIKRGGLKYLTVLTRNRLTAGEVETDAYSPGFDKPKYYHIAAGSETKQMSLRLHPSRLVVFNGDEIPDSCSYSGINYGWSDSILTSRITNIRNLEATAQNISALVHEAKIDVIQVPGLMEQLAQTGTAYEKNLIKRFSLANQAKGNFSTLILDAEENYEQKTFNFGTLPMILDRAMQLVAGDADIPVTRLFGLSPGGLNSTGDGDLRNYYDSIKADQTTKITPAMTVLDKVLIQSTLGAMPDDLTQAWRPLWQTTMRERAETGKLLTDIAERLVILELVSSDVIAESLVDVLAGSDILPGLTAVMSDDDDNDSDNDEVLPDDDN